MKTPKTQRIQTQKIKKKKSLPKKLVTQKNSETKNLPVSEILAYPYWQKDIEAWFKENARDLPWRKNKDPYQIWISEIMLQQTTVKAVIPLYLHFMKKFPNLKKLSKAETSDVLASWKGLGYYNRARNIHKAAQILVGYNSFPKTAEELIKLPGFGDYTSRAVSSQAFGEKKGVLDGNVIRVLSRFLNIHTEWWVPKNKSQLQILADTLASTSKNSSHYNQGVMELGATICTPQSPSCLICPVQKNCASFKKGEQSILPLKKKRKEKELWVWEVTKLKTSNSLALTNSSTRPVLKKQWIPTGSWSKVDKKPKSFDIKHNVTHHEIFVRIKEVDEIKAEHTSFPIKNIESHSPFSITQKVIEWKSPT